MFYQALSWWILLGISFVFSFLWQIVECGRGRSRESISAIFGLAIFVVLVVCFFINGIWAGITFLILQGVFVGINQSLARKVLSFLLK